MPRLAESRSINEVIVLISEGRIMLCCTANTSYRSQDNTSDGAINCSTKKDRCWEVGEKKNPAMFHHYLQIRGGKTVVVTAKLLSLFLRLIWQRGMARHLKVKCIYSSWVSSSQKRYLLLLTNVGRRHVWHEVTLDRAPQPRCPTCLSLLRRALWHIWPWLDCAFLCFLAQKSS